MRVLTFYGTSDDLFEIEGTTGDEPDEIGCFQRAVAVEIRQQDHGLIVTGQYALGGAPTWSIGLAPIDEDQPMPDWPLSWAFEGYTAKLTVHAPDHATVRKLGKS